MAKKTKTKDDERLEKLHFGTNKNMSFATEVSNVKPKIRIAALLAFC